MDHAVLTLSLIYTRNLLSNTVNGMLKMIEIKAVNANPQMLINITVKKNRERGGAQKQLL
jgi:hypothetical protein